MSKSQHPDDAAVDAFAQALKEKLARSRAKGRGGWETCPPEVLSRMLREHVEKADPRDVAAFCMMLWHMGASIAPSGVCSHSWTSPYRERMDWVVRCNICGLVKPDPL